jgi:hypothetical protein
VYFLIWGVVVTIVFLPFLFGMMRPSFNDGNPYSILISMFNLPVTLTLGGVIEWVKANLSGATDPQKAVLAQFYVSVGFWSILGGIIGLIRDLNGNKGG